MIIELTQLSLFVNPKIMQYEKFKFEICDNIFGLI